MILHFLILVELYFKRKQLADTMNVNKKYAPKICSLAGDCGPLPVDRMEPQDQKLPFISPAFLSIPQVTGYTTKIDKQTKIRATGETAWHFRK